MIRIVSVALAAVLAAGTAVRAQTYVPGQAQQNLDKFQLQLQTEQLQRMQQQNNLALQNPDPAARAQAAARQQQLQRETDENFALQQQMLQPRANSQALHDRLQAGSARLQQLQQQPAPRP